MPCPEHHWPQSDWIHSTEGQKAAAHAQTEQAQQFYQHLSDLIAIWWTFLDRLKRSGNFSLPKDFDSLAKRRMPTFDVWAIFVHQTKSTFQASLQEILDPDPYPPSSGRHDALTQHRYFLQLNDQAIEGGEYVSRRTNRRIFSDQLISAGINTAIEVGLTGPARLLQAWHPSTGLHLSKVDLHQSSTPQLDLGLRAVGRNQISDFDLAASALYCPADLKTGVNLERLRDLGYQTVLGCPAGKAISAKSRAFLQSLKHSHFPDIEMPQGIVLAHLMKDLFQYFWHDFMPWYCSLSKQKRDEFFNTDSRAMLDRAEEVYADP